MKDIIKISVIIPAFNAGESLQRALNSVEMQSLSEIEIIIINDASSDNTLKIAQENQVKDKRINIIINKVNQGLATCRNMGIKLAKGKYIFFLDADDEIINNNALKILYDSAFKQKVDVIVFDFYKVYNGYNKYKTRNIENNIILKSVASKKQFAKAGVIAWNKLYLTSFLINNNIVFPKKLLFEDIAFTWQVIITARSILYLKQPFYAYWQTFGSIMNSRFDDDKVYDIIQSMRVVYDYLVNHNLYDEYKAIYEPRLFTTFAYFFKRSHSRSYKLFISMANDLQKIDLLTHKKSLSIYKYYKYKMFLQKRYLIYKLFFTWI